MIYSLAVFFAALLFSISIIFIRKPFFNMALATLSLLDTLIELDEDETVKQKKMIKKLSKQLTTLFAFLFFVGLSFAIASLPLIVFSWLSNVEFNNLDFSSWKFYTPLIVGSIPPFIVFSLFHKENSDYSEWSKLLHKLILDNKSISRSIFSFETKIYKEKLRTDSPNFVVVTGLARAGTTALTTKLFETGHFHSLDYSNMPFLLAPNIWKKFYKPKKDKKKERKHGDKVLFGYSTVEALEEYFFKAFLKDSYIKENSLIEHSIDENIYKKYLKYQDLIRTDKNLDSLYLTKNNNFILRYESIRKLNENFISIFIFRDPIEHAYSLLKQHKRFIKFQEDDLFVLEYMNWLGHHEFGLGQKYFQFSDTSIDDSLSKDDLEYWLQIWINYYRRLLDLEDQKIILIDYIDFLKQPKKTLSYIGGIINRQFDLEKIESFDNPNKYEGSVGEDISKEARKVYDLLVLKKVDIHQ